MKRVKNQQGSLTLETAIVLPIFIFIVLFIFSLFGVISTHNQISHAFIQAAKSLSLDPYIYQEAELAGEDATKFWGGLSDMAIDIMRIDNDPYFISTSDWSENGRSEDASDIVLSVNESTAKMRFIGYLTGGDEAAAEEKLDNLGVVNGLDGVSFALSVDGDDMMTIRISYAIELVFDFWNSGEMQINQELKVKLWK